jgi:hypothetical protein
MIFDVRLKVENISQNRFLISSYSPMMFIRMMVLYAKRTGMGLEEFILSRQRKS